MISLGWALKDPSPLVRAYAASGFSSVPPEQRLKPLLPLLEDPALAVRDEAVRALADVPKAQVPVQSLDTFSAALADYETRLRGNADLPGGRLNLAVLLNRQGRQEEAMDQYRQALRLDPYFVPARSTWLTLQRPNNSWMRRKRCCAQVWHWTRCLPPTTATWLICWRCCW